VSLEVASRDAGVVVRSTPELGENEPPVVGNVGRVLTGRVGLSPIMIGRAGALDRLRGVIELADVHSSDLPTIALIGGEAGIGKTRLLREMLSTLPRDVTVFSAIAEPRSLDRSFDVASQLVPTDEPESPESSGRAALAAISAATRNGRVAIVIEDIHWIDAESVGVIDSIARQPWPNVVIFATYRPSDLSRGAPGGDLVLRLERRNEVEQFRLDRLDRNEVGALMSAINGRLVSSAAVEAVYRRSGGVPFVVEELMRCAGPEACSEDIVSAQLPWSLEEAVRQQLAGLSSHERAIVEVLAVFGQPASFDVLAAISGYDERDLLSHLRGLVERGVIEEIRNDRLWFGHALVAESVTQQLLGRERRRLHEACFDTIAQIAPDDYAALAHHASGAGRYDEIVAIAKVGARAYLERGASFPALRLACEGLAEDPNEPDLLAVATEAAWRLDFLPEALVHAKSWLAVAPTVSQRIDAMRLVARIHHELSEYDDSYAHTEQIMALAQQLPEGVDLARAEAAVAQMLMLGNQHEAIDWAERAIGHAEAHGDRVILVQAKIEWASAMSQFSERSIAVAALREAADEARRLGDGVQLSRALNNTIELLPPLSEESRAVRDELRDTASAHGLDKLGTLTIMWWDAKAAFAMADLPATRRLVDEFVAWTSARPKASMFRVELAAIAAEEGRVADAMALLADKTIPSPCDKIEINVQRLNVAAIGRQFEDGRNYFDCLIKSEDLADSWFATGDVLNAVASALELGISPTEIRERLIDASLANHPAHAALATHAEGLLALAEGRTADAVEALSLTVAVAPDIVIRPIEGSLRLALAQAHLAEGNRIEALGQARLSRDVLSRWPGWRRDRAEAMVARLEGSNLRAVGDLTARESEVANLIAEGLTNGQLAERLFISPKTAAVHVSNILAKLGLSSRTEIAAWAIRRELPVAGN
jgi:DNA-binding NarL/FixJ family response regulator